MSKIQSHAECSHDSTKAARAKCRRSRAKFADAFTAALAEPAVIETPEAVFEAIEITRENWREYADQPVVIFTRVSEDEEAPVAEGVKITGWGKRWVNYVTADGQTKRTDALYTGARTVEG